MDNSLKSAQQGQYQPPTINPVHVVPQPPVSVSIGAKEQGVITQTETQNIIVPTETEPKLSPEVKEAGVEVVQSENPPLSQDIKQMGVEMAKDAVPVATQPIGLVQLPMTKQQALQALKQNKKDPKLSVDWLALFVLKLIKKQEKQKASV